ncbi:chemotaxis protein CheW [Paenibacillus sp. YYML68]|uniref:chemotaxis protein CheW n=1 Tax=Paenibacillus sp. YYML68 TaxID=2909250 RepID=UPI0024925665|nr:chemotaxis protein CheW [Paenibacillus sp. YYML68]
MTNQPFGRMDMPFISVGIGSEQFALPIHEVREIIRLQEITEVPHARAGLLGVINLRGTIVPVIDISERLHVTASPFSSATRIVIVSFKGEDVGLIVDSVHQVVEMELLQSSSDNGLAGHRAGVLGIGRTGDSLVGLLELEAMLTDF